MANLAAETGFQDDLEIGLPKKEFNQMKLESHALLTKFDNKTVEEFEAVNEFQFNTGYGSLLIYNKDQK